MNRVERYQLSLDENSATADKVIIDDIPSAKYHSGGRIHFGPDGMLYIGTGDARGPDDSQDLSSLAGKILRLTPEGDIPKDNPHKGQPVYVSGLRNVEAFDWKDPKTLLIADHGPSGEYFRSGGDEVSVARAGDNLGWPKIWKCQTENQSKNKMVTPVLSWKSAVPPGGAAVYTGSLIPEWKGSFLIGILGSRHLQRVVVDEKNGKLIEHEVYFQRDSPSGFGRLREVIMSPRGELFVTTSNCDGRGNCGEEKDKILKVMKSK